ncbi:MAG: hypothetical protein UR52_C0008G0027 [Candidatus Gottesmanbacteria bacterium GW2011_GWA1_34_13]|uniref:Uncharacterized protein n=1 Tax=Candidatus Gottesmanbacteria bacterium GW2011_GWA1_34_13 TaxID=1618434 RepID=A0A0G0DVZ1_9BACT|nr:MAG: hypothetical protein UR52_C0008G0027 [Candidatus Gottesmanbacteria bacterium GW2011_GWA1_34_13]
MFALTAKIHQMPKNSLSKLWSFVEQLFFWWKPKSTVNEDVKYNYKKYHKTYELLEKYDREATEDPQTLVDAGRLHPFISELQKKSRKHGRANTTN